jgi:hypothetical protein
VYDIDVDESRRGYGKAAMVFAEEGARRRGQASPFTLELATTARATSTDRSGLRNEVAMSKHI